MKKTVKFINEFVLAIASLRAGFVFATLGTIAQTFHTYFIAYDFSSFTGVGQIIQAVIVSLFLSGGLLFYTVRTGNAEGYDEKSKYNKIATSFMVFETFINLYYWGDKIVFTPWLTSETIEWYRLIIAVPFSIAIPVILKSYAGEISIKEIKDIEPVNQVVEFDVNEVTDLVIEELQSKEHSLIYTKIDHENSDYKIKFKDDSKDSINTGTSDHIPEAGNTSSKVSESDRSIEQKSDS